MCDRTQLTEKVLDGRARRAAHRVGLVARKSRRRGGGYILLGAIRNDCVHGSYWELSAEDVIEFCAEREECA
jgi:hypothetical protein